MRWVLTAAGVVVLFLVVLLFMDPRLEEHLLSSAPVVVQVTVVRVEVGTQPKYASPQFWHLVRLPDGAEVSLESPQLFKPGDQVEAVLIRGRITGALRLRAPYRLVREHE